MKHVFTPILVITSAMMLVLPFGINAQNDVYWNQFRGPNGDGKAIATDLPIEFSETQNIRWRTAIPHEGWSSPVVWEDQIWLTTGLEDGRELFAICVDLNSGEIIHNIKVFDVADPQLEYEGMNTHATPTPIIEDGRVYVHFGTYGTACLDTKTGKKLWERRDLNCDHRVRPASSPIIDGGMIFCLDAKDGSLIWRDRIRGEYWASPIYANGKIYFSSKGGKVSVILAEREYKLLGENEFDASFIASPAVAGNNITLRSTTHLYCFAEGYDMAPQPETVGKPKSSKSEQSMSNSMSELPLNVTGYYMGGKTRDDGEFEATFLIEAEDLDKDEWPIVTFTGESFRASFANLTQYQRVTLNLAEGSAKKGRAGK